MGSQNWWFGDPNDPSYTESNPSIGESNDSLSGWRFQGVIVEQGKMGTTFFVTHSGTLEVSVNGNLVV